MPLATARGLSSAKGGCGERGGRHAARLRGRLERCAGGTSARAARTPRGPVSRRTPSHSSRTVPPRDFDGRRRLLHRAGQRHCRPAARRVSHQRASAGGATRCVDDCRAAGHARTCLPAQRSCREGVGVAGAPATGAGRPWLQGRASRAEASRPGRRAESRGGQVGGVPPRCCARRPDACPPSG